MRDGLTPSDRLRLRSVQNKARLVREHLEAMDRDVHGPEFDPWKGEVDHLWRDIFRQIDKLSPEPQARALEMVRELWVSYITHYGALAGGEA